MNPRAKEETFSCNACKAYSWSAHVTEWSESETNGDCELQPERRARRTSTLGCGHS